MSRPRTPADYVALAFESFRAGFKTLSAKKDAMGGLNLAYELLRKEIMDLCLDASGPDRKMTPGQEELYYALPFDLHNWRPKHSEMVFKVFPAADKSVTEIEKLVVLRKKFNAAEVAPKGPTKVQREQSISLSATGKLYAAEFGKMQPELEKDFTDYIEGQFKRLAGKYGLKMAELLGGRYGHDTFGRYKLPAGVDGDDIRTYKGLLTRFMSAGTFHGGAPQLDYPKLRKEAETYAKGQIAQFVVKLTQKLGDLTDVRIKHANAGSFEYTIDGKLRGHDVRVNQDRKFVVNQHGTAFHQWPALIYVDGKFTTEAAFKRLSAGA